MLVFNHPEMSNPSLGPQGLHPRTPWRWHYPNEHMSILERFAGHHIDQGGTYEALRGRDSDWSCIAITNWLR